jgi:hypothetical protein
MIFYIALEPSLKKNRLSIVKNDWKIKIYNIL